MGSVKMQLSGQWAASEPRRQCEQLAPTWTSTRSHPQPWDGDPSHFRTLGQKEAMRSSDQMKW